jgi:hypothetical protein
MRIVIFLAALAIILFSSTTTAQVVYVLDDNFLGNTCNISLPSAGYPQGIPGPWPPPPLILVNFQAGALAMPPPAGGHAIDQLTRTFYSTDGLIVFADFHPFYAPFIPALPAPAPILLGGGPITGLAVDAVGGILYMCDAISFQAFSNVFPYPSLSPAVALPFIGPLPLTGLGFETSTGTLWACDSLGAIYNFTTAGVPVGTQPVSIAPPPIGQAYGGLAVNTVNGPGSLPPWSCSTQVSGFHIVVTDGVNVYDALNPGALPIPVPVGGGSAYGLAFSNDNQALTSPTFACPSNGLFPAATISQPTHNGTGPAMDIILSSAPANTSVTLMVDFCPIPGGLTLPAGDILMINPFSPTYRTFSLVTDPFGIARLPVTLSNFPPGVQFSVQWYFADPLNPPFGVCFSNALALSTGLP